MSNNKVYLWTLQDRESALHTNKYVAASRVWSTNKYGSIKDIGGCINLISRIKPATKNEWVLKYFESGREAQRLIKDLQSTDAKDIEVKTLQIKRDYGRTPEELLRIAIKLRDDVKKAGTEISLEEAFNYTAIKVIDESFVGISREREALKLLNEAFTNKGFKIIEADDYKDIQLGVDLEIKNKKGELICGIQVKGHKKLWNNPDKNYMKEQIQRLRDENNRYTKKYGVPVIQMNFDRNLKLENPGVFDRIESLSKEKEITINKTKKRDLER